MSDPWNSPDCIGCESFRERVRTLERVLLQIEAIVQDASLEPESLRRYVLARLEVHVELLDEPESIRVPPFGRV